MVWDWHPLTPMTKVRWLISLRISWLNNVVTLQKTNREWHFLGFGPGCQETIIIIFQPFLWGAISVSGRDKNSHSVSMLFIYFILYRSTCFLDIQRSQQCCEIFNEMVIKWKKTHCRHCFIQYQTKVTNHGLGLPMFPMTLATSWAVYC